jgi:hypothetical protein
MQHHEDNTGGELVWGQRDIGRLIGRDARSAGRLLRLEMVPGARRVGGRWAISRSALIRAFAEVA